MHHANLVKEIEHERNRFLNDPTIISGMDFGAGSRLKNSRKISSIARYGISSKKDCLFLLGIANIINANTLLELGTSLGISTAYLASSNHLKSIYTFEGNEPLANMSSKLFDRLDIKHVQLIKGDIDCTLPKALDKIEKLDLVIIDANHTRKALLKYYGLLKTRLSEFGVIVVDDISWSTDMYRGWKKIISFPEVTLSLEFLNKGLLFFKKGIQKQRYVLSI